MTEYQKWLELTKDCPDLHRELEEIADRPAEIEDRFYRELEFGTAGLRGVLGAGTNRMNVFTLRRASYGVARYLTEHYRRPSVALSYDSRHKSAEFAREAALVYAAMGVKVWIYPRLTPVPMLSYAVRNLGCSGGALVTASHNPKQYNGYKVYNEDGCQITAEAADTIQRYILEADYAGLPRADEERARAEGLIEDVPERVYESYMAEIRKYSLTDGDISLKIVYSPLNGAGNRPVRDILKRIGCKNVSVVPEQENPDPDFTTCPYPNPEIREALELSIRQAEREGADLVLATDPDADRVGIAVRHGGAMQLLSGNDTGNLLCYYLLSRKKKMGTLPKRPVVITTIVSTPMPDAVVPAFGGEVFDVYTGFKNIGDKMKELEEEGRLSDLILAFEESYGYLPGGYVRDKDAVAASMLICEMADYYHEQGLDLCQVLEKMYAEFGYYASRTQSIAFGGKEGLERMAALIEALRRNPPAELAGSPVLTVKDYLTGVNGMEPQNVLEFSTAALKLIVRPSGTEPKLKVYAHTRGEDREACARLLDRVLAEVKALFA